MGKKKKGRKEIGCVSLNDAPAIDHQVTPGTARGQRSRQLLAPRVVSCQPGPAISAGWESSAVSCVRPFNWENPGSWPRGVSGRPVSFPCPWWLFPLEDKELGQPASHTQPQQLLWERPLPRVSCQLAVSHRASWSLCQLLARPGDPKGRDCAGIKAKGGRDAGTCAADAVSPVGKGMSPFGFAGKMCLAMGRVSSRCQAEPWVPEGCTHSCRSAWVPQARHDCGSTHGVGVRWEAGPILADRNNTLFISSNPFCPLPFICPRLQGDGQCHWPRVSALSHSLCLVPIDGALPLLQGALSPLHGAWSPLHGALPLLH